MDIMCVYNDTLHYTSVPLAFYHVQHSIYYHYHWHLLYVLYVWYMYNTVHVHFSIIVSQCETQSSLCASVIPATPLPLKGRCQSRVRA